MIGIFKQKSPANILVMLLFGIAIKLPMFLHPHAPVLRPGDGVFYEGILDYFSSTGKSFPGLYPLITFILLFLQAAILSRFINNQRMMNKINYLPGMAYLLITSLLPEWNYFSSPLLINTILLFVLSGLFKVYNQNEVKGIIYNIGLALGIAGFLLVSSLTFIIWILLAFAIIRPFRLNEWLLCILGITTLFYFYAIYIFVEGHNWNELLPHISIGIPALKQTPWLAASVFLILVPFLIGGYYIQENLRRLLIHVRKGWSLMLLYLLAALFLPFVNTSDTFENWIMAMLPMAAFHASAYMYASWRIMVLLLFWSSMAFIVSYQYYGPGW